MKHWTKDMDSFLCENYPNKGKMWCATNMRKSEASIRARASRLGIKQSPTGEFRADWTERAAKSKIGKKRPDQAIVMRRLHEEGKLGVWTDNQREKMSLIKKEWHKENEHPRGALGYKHTVETRMVLGEKSRRSHSLRTDDQIYEKTKKTLTTRHGMGKYASERKGVTWKGGWREIGGLNKYYRSRWEANFGRYLQFLLEHGEIAKWEHEPEVFWFDGIRRGVVSYLPDFRVVENSGSLTYYEVKGWMDDRSATKLKRMKKYHPNIKLVLIEKDQYYKIFSKVGRLISGWERDK